MTEIAKDSQKNTKAKNDSTSLATAEKMEHPSTGYLIKVTIKDLLGYSEELKATPSLSINEYLKKRQPNSDNLHYVADLCNLTIGKPNSTELLYLKQANFTGTILSSTSFIGCDLEGASFAGVYLENVTFRETILNFVNFRGAQMHSCHFAESYQYPPWRDQANGILLSCSASSIRVYADIKNELAKKNEKQRLINNKKLEIKELSQEVDLIDKIGISSSTHKITALKKAEDELELMKKGIFRKDYIVHKSFSYLFNSEKTVFDPVIFSQEKTHNIIIPKKYYSASRQDLNEYLEAIKSQYQNPISFTDFIKNKYFESFKDNVDNNCEIVVDLSSKVNVFGNNEWNRLNFSGIDFSNADLSNCNFSGSDLSRSIFKNAKLVNSNFESSKLTNAVLNNVDATGCNFINSDLSSAVIENSNLQETNLSWANCKNTKISNCNFKHCLAINSAFVDSNIENADWSYSNCYKIDFSNSNISSSNFQHCFANYGCFEGIKATGANFSHSFLNNSIFQNSIWYKTVFSQVKALNSNLSNIKISEDCNLEKTDFSHSILDGIKAPNGHFAGCNFDYAKMSYGKLVGANLDNTSFRFAELNNCVFSEANCLNSDFTKSTLYNVTFIRAELKNSLFYGAIAKNTDFTKTNFENSDWQNIKIYHSILEETNNHRTRINDNSHIESSVIKNLNGQFYHYDEDAFMNLMFIEQQQALQHKIQNAETILKWGILGIFLKYFSGKYNISIEEAKRLDNIRKKNETNLDSYIRKIKSDLKNNETSSDLALYILAKNANY